MRVTFTNGGSRFIVPAGLAVAVAAGLARSARAEEVFAVTSDNTLLTFDTSTPFIVESSIPITGLLGNVVSIDVRPADGALYAVTDSSRLFRVDPTSGAAVEVGLAPFSPTLAGAGIGSDFNPVTDRLRVVTGQNQNLRLNPDDGTVEDGDPLTTGTQTDTPLAFDITDPNFGFDPDIVAAAHTNNIAGAGSTTAYVIDADLDVLARLGDADGSDTSRNAGTLHTVGPLGIDVLGLGDMDFSRTSGNAYAVLTLAGEASSRVYRISLVTGAAVLMGSVGDLRPVRTMAIGPATSVVPVPERNLIGLTAGGTLVKFRSDDPETIRGSVSVTGLVPGDTLIAIDVRPNNGRLYGLGSSGRLYVVNSTTGVATAIGRTPFDVPLQGDAFGFDFNAAGDRIRIVSDQGQNLRIRPDTGGVVDGQAGLPGIQGDTALAFAPGDLSEAQTPHLVAAAFDRNFPSAQGTTFYAIDSNLDVLVRLGSPGGSPESPNRGRLHTVGALGVDATAVSGFEIIGDSTGLAVIALPGGTSRLYQIDLGTGAATLLGNVGAGETLRDVSVAPSANPPAPGDDLRVRDMTIHLDFARPDHDSIHIVGSLPFPGTVAGQTIAVDVGGYAKTFVLNSSGKRRDDGGTKSVRDDDVFQFVGGLRDGRISFDLMLRREDVSDELTDEGMGGDVDARHELRTVHLSISVNGVETATDVALRYSAKAGRTGTATN